MRAVDIHIHALPGQTDLDLHRRKRSTERGVTDSQQECKGTHPDAHENVLSMQVSGQRRDDNGSSINTRFGSQKADRDIAPVTLGSTHTIAIGRKSLQPLQVVRPSGARRKASATRA